MITPGRIQGLAEPVEDIYVHMTNELMANIAKHIKSPTWTNTARWEIQKLSELGQLTRENAAIINRYIKEIPKAVRDTMTATRQAALGDIERQLSAAAQDGYLTPPLADSTERVFQELLAQAEDRFNLVNTQMLQSSLEGYTQAVSVAAEAMPQEALDILNRNAAALAMGTVTRTTAVRTAILDLSEKGLTGFIDRAGRHWSPEAYVNMVMRTTVHNAAIAGIRERMRDYGTDVFQISAHAGARPRCAPYQGWFCCWERSDGGEIELGDGRTVEYVSIHETSYGEAAGIFGVNCGHMPIPVVAGVSIPSAQDYIQDPATNARMYKESQEQRQLERDIRKAKRDLAMLGNLATKEDKQKLLDAQAEMRAFIARTGRTRRYDREQIIQAA